MDVDAGGEGLLGDDGDFGCPVVLLEAYGDGFAGAYAGDGVGSDFFVVFVGIFLVSAAAGEKQGCCADEKG